MRQLNQTLNERVVACGACPRLVAWRTEVAREKRASFAGWEYWGKAVPNFGDEGASLLIVGLAPAAHGANRTGRMFTGDRSGDWLYRALWKAGLASQAEATDAQDGLKLHDVLITAAVHCAPPQNKPTPEEFARCAPFLAELLESRQWRGILCLGKEAWDALHKHYGIRPRPAFGHGATSVVPNGAKVFASFHPSQQNTFTKKLTEPMLDAVVSAWKAS